MSQMKYLHLMRREKFTEGFISFVDDNFDVNQHVFFLIGGVKTLSINHSERLSIIDIQTPSKLLLLLPKFILLSMLSKKIIVHGFSQAYQIIFFIFQPWLINKMFWVIWGADLYTLDAGQETYAKKFFNCTKKHIIKRCRGIVSLVPGDYELAKKITKTKATYYNCMMYPHAITRQKKTTKNRKNNTRLTIMVGNSASIENEHLSVFDKIKNTLNKTNNHNVKILVPLSYGDPKYAEKVIRYGTSVFGTNFAPITAMLDKESYFKLLAEVDIAMFGFKRQQAMGNILSLLGLGKKIYIRTDITPWNFLKEKGFDLFDIEQLDLSLEVDEINNNKLILSEFSIAKSAEQWRRIFEC